MNTVSKIAATIGTSLALAGFGAASANADSIQVQSGDTLSKIAHQHNTDVDTLVALNNIQDRNLIHVGDTLELDGQAIQVPAVQTPVATPLASSNESPQVQSTQTAAPAVNTQSAPSATVAQAPAATPATSSALQNLINRESGGNVNATNGQYYGIGQLSPALRAIYGGNSANYDDQLQAMQSYINDRYGSAEAAWAHSQSTGWY